MHLNKINFILFNDIFNWFNIPERCYFEEITHRFWASNILRYKYRHYTFYNIKSCSNYHNVIFRYTSINKLQI